ncbi:MAG: hypothetical protein U9R79_07560 [Armatimonadota bacterium]|nr:hypothetical protein [Armatimonadota bacterium]
MPVPRTGMTTIMLLTIAALATASMAADDANLVANPGFEEGGTEDGTPVHWSLREPEGVALQADGGHAGDGYVHFVDERDDAGLFLESQRVPARPGGTYTASAWFRTADDCQPGVYINIYDQLGERIHNKYARATGPTDGWARVEVTAAAPQMAWEVSASLYAYVGDVGEFDADDVALTVQGGAEPGSAGLERAEPGDREPAEIADRLELFVDSFLIDGTAGAVERRLHRPTRREIVLQLDRPWEGNTSAYFALVQDGERILLYYRGSSEETGQVTCVAESTDGIYFQRPTVGLFEFDGSTDNNIIWQGKGAHNFTPFKDPNPAAPDDQRFKALGYSDHGHGLAAHVSPDGIHWQDLTGEPVITKGAFDSQNLAFWDPLRGLYVEYHRQGREGVRDIMTCTSEDFVNWTEPVFIEYADERKQHMYTNGIRPYFRAPHIYIGTPARFVPSRKKIDEHPSSGVSDAVLMSSRDGLHFERWEEGFIRPAAEPEVWTDRNNYPGWGMMQTSPEEISLYWTEHYRHPTMRLRRGTIRTDGFVSVHAGGDMGEIITRPLIFSGDRLVVNYATSAVGWMRFELCDEAGEPIEGYSLRDSELLFGNEIQHTVTWNDASDLSALAGTPVRLRVRLYDADLYSFRFPAE